MWLSTNVAFVRSFLALERGLRAPVRHVPQMSFAILDVCAVCLVKSTSRSWNRLQHLAGGILAICVRGKVFGSCWFEAWKPL